MGRGAFDFFGFVLVLVAGNFFTSNFISSGPPFWCNPLCTGPSGASNVVNVNGAKGVSGRPAVFSMRINSTSMVRYLQQLERLLHVPIDRHNCNSQAN